MRRAILLASPLLVLGACTGPDLVPLGTSSGSSPARTLYLQQISGRYSPQPICAGQELQIEFAPESVYIGETGCNIARIERITGGVALSLTACQAEGMAQADRRVEVVQTGNGALEVTTPAGRRTVQPCFD